MLQRSSGRHRLEYDGSLRYGRAVMALPPPGRVRPITRWGEPVLHRACRPVTAFDDDLRALVADMVATMYAADGVGLAANQIGVDLAVFVFDCHDDEGAVGGVVCNPTLSVPETLDRPLVEMDEGCLSLPGAFVTCARPDDAEVTGWDEHGESTRFGGNGLLARCLQHESDHLNGTVFGDRLSTKLRKRLLREAAVAADDFGADWPA